MKNERQRSRNIVLVLWLLMLTSAMRAQPCQCDEGCPPLPFTNCSSAWNAPQTISLAIYIDKLARSCLVEVEYCCRIRTAQGQCSSFVVGPIGASCETAITCVRIPKECVIEVAPAGTPIVDSEVRHQIYSAILDQLICGNVCQNGLPNPPEQPYEWVFSLPSCLRYLKTGGQNTAFCLASCGSRVCVYAFRVITSSNPNYSVRCLERVSTTWSSAVPSYCDTFNNGCVYDDCDPDFTPQCTTWEFE